LVEDHPYRTAECPINEALVEKLDELTRNVQEQAIEQAWSLDWTALAALRRQGADARVAKNQCVSLRKIGEMISLLGQAARFYRKSASSAQSLD
jgi:protein phosphatase